MRKRDAKGRFVKKDENVTSIPTAPKVTLADKAEARRKRVAARLNPMKARDKSLGKPRRSLLDEIKERTRRQKRGQR